MRRLPKADQNWNALLQTLEGHSREVSAVALSPDGKTLASASINTMVKVWDTGSGALLQTLNIDTLIETLSFSNDGTSF